MIEKAIKHIDKNDFFIAIGMAALTISILCGKYSAARLLAGAEYPPFLLEFRLWFLIIALLPLLVSMRQYISLPKNHLILLTITSLTLLLGHIALYTPNDIKAEYLIDTLYLIIFCSLISIYAKTKYGLQVFTLTTALVAIVLVTLAIIGFQNPEEVYGVTPIGTPFTFYKLQMLGFFSILYLSYCSKNIYRQLTIYLIASLLLYGSLISLSRTALLAVCATLFILLTWHLITRRYIRAIMLSGCMAIALSSFTLTDGNALSARITQSGATAQTQQNSNIVVSDEAYAALPKNEVGHTTGCLNGLYLVYPDTSELDPHTENWYLVMLENTYLICDRSMRMKMANEALNVFTTNKLIGAGLGNYYVNSAEIYKKIVETFRYPHNIFLEILSGTGITGLLIFAFTFYILLISLIRRMLTKHSLIVWLACIVFLFLSSFFSGNFYDFRFSWIILLLVLYHENKSEVTTMTSK